MTNKINCWEYKQCGRGPKQNNIYQPATCHVAEHKVSNDMNSGVNGGRLCWLILEARFRGEVKQFNRDLTYPCFSCDFRYKVMKEEGLRKVCETTSDFLNS